MRQTWTDDSRGVSGTLYILSAPSGAGKTSLLAALLQRLNNVALSISHTTRAPRASEQDGVHYHFVDAERFLDMIAADALLEHAKVFGNFYGTSRESVQVQLASGQDVILEIDWQGARQVRKALPQSCSIFILPPSHEALEKRLRSRGQDSEAEIARRLGEAKADCAHFTEYTYTVVNDDFATALADLESIFRANRLRTAEQERRYREILASLLATEAHTS